MAAVQINESSFKSEVLESTLPVLVDFWATWCGPCQRMGPLVEQISDEQAGKLKVCKVNVDENPELAEKYEVMSIPNFLVFKDGKLSGQEVGVVEKEKLLALAGL